jgi:hypothetical protein
MAIEDLTERKASEPELERWKEDDGLTKRFRREQRTQDAP